MQFILFQSFIKSKKVFHKKDKDIERNKERKTKEEIYSELKYSFIAVIFHEMMSAII